ncbi:MAG: phosphatidylglycerophosphatase [Verrucomicrobiales bacterium]|nr:phosphatidylglycerophosphatase [Verrucomicrobiales bacterium]
MQGFILWLAQGFGIGRIRVMPGTFGSLVGILWVMLLLVPRNFWVYVAGTIFGVGISIWICGAGERILKQRDPSSVVMDEITAMPICFMALFAKDWFKNGHLPEPQSLVLTPYWKMVLVVFVLFRIFDIAKPWPVRQSQDLHGGWGVTVDDVLAAFYVAALSLIAAMWPFYKAV